MTIQHILETTGISHRGLQRSSRRGEFRVIYVLSIDVLNVSKRNRNLYKKNPLIYTCKHLMTLSLEREPQTTPTFGETCREILSIFYFHFVFG